MTGTIIAIGYLLGAVFDPNLPCQASADIRAWLSSKYHEKPAAHEVAPSGKSVRVLWVGPDTYSVVVSSIAGVSCLITAGPLPLRV